MPRTLDGSFGGALRRAVGREVSVTTGGNIVTGKLAAVLDDAIEVDACTARRILVPLGAIDFVALRTEAARC
jgi:hypothetical protein